MLFVLGLTAGCGKNGSGGSTPSNHKEVLDASAHIEKQLEDLNTHNALVLKKLDDLAIEVAAVKRIAESFQEEDEAEKKAAPKRR